MHVVVSNLLRNTMIESHQSGGNSPVQIQACFSLASEVCRHFCRFF